jgi:hypothetical protein
MSLELALERNTAALEKLIGILSGPVVVDVPLGAVEDPPKTKRTKKEAAPATVGEFVEGATAPSPAATATDAPATEAAAAPTEPLVYKVVSDATINLIKVRGRDAAVKVLKSFGVTKAGQIEEARWPAYLAAVELEKENPL